MIELLVGVITIVFLYWLGGVLMPDYEPIKQELIKLEGEE
jgi:hypothetical protein